MSMTWPILRRALLGALTLTGMAFATSALGQQPTAQPAPWRHGVLEAKSDAGFVFMPSKGGFAEKQGLKVETMQFKGDALALKALIAGELDTYEGSPGGPMLAASNGADIKLRMANCGDPRAVDGLLVPVGHAVPDGLVEQCRAAEMLDHDLRRHLALPEARDLHVLPRRGRDSLHLALDGVARNLDVQAHF